MKVLVTGVKGQLGYDIVNECQKRNIEAVGVDVEEMDITDEKQVENVITDEYDAVIHCAAWTAVDKAEDEVAMCRKVNKDGTENIARVCQQLDIPLMYFSTDYVFDGMEENQEIIDKFNAEINNILIKMNYIQILNDNYLYNKITNK